MFYVLTAWVPNGPDSKSFRFLIKVQGEPRIGKGILAEVVGSPDARMATKLTHWSDEDNFEIDEGPLNGWAHIKDFDCEVVTRESAAMMIFGAKE